MWVQALDAQETKPNCVCKDINIVRKDYEWVGFELS
jgi:hypothetical protein